MAFYKKCFFGTLLAVLISCSPASSPDATKPSLEPPVKTHVFVRAQWHYGLQKNHFYGYWVDRPLFVNPDLADKNVHKGLGLSPASFAKTLDIMKLYGLDGMAFFPETPSRAPLLDLIRDYNTENFEFLAELATSYTKENTARTKDVLQKALEIPSFFRIKDRLVVTSYDWDSLSIEESQKIWQDIKENLGNRFLFLPSVFSRLANQSLIDWRRKFHAGQISDALYEEAKEGLRSWLRVSDGLHFPTALMLKTPERTFDEEFYRDFIIRMMEEVLDEPEFQGKLFSLSAVVGHENDTILGYTLDCDGTKTLRHSMEAAMSADPDIILIPEWDEQNENTSLRPTIYNGTSSMRILRYYMAQIHKKELTPIPGDNVEVPNLIVSYRKLLAMGEELKVELLNVPDGSGAGGYTARLILLTPEGREVFGSETFSFDKQKLEDHTVILPSEKFADSLVLIPRLEIETDGKSSVVEDGLHYVAIRPTWNWDYKWVKQPLRDLMHPSRVEFSISQPNPDGSLAATGRIEADEPLAYVEVLDNDDVVYSHSKANEWQENGEQVVFSLYWQSATRASLAREIPGSISLLNAEGKWRIPDGVTNLPTIRDQTLEKLKPSLEPQRVLVAIPRQALDKAVFKFDFPGAFQGEVPASQILKDSMFGISGSGRFSLVVSRFLRPFQMPSHLDVQSAEFSVPVLPDLPDSVYHLQAVAKSGHIYRSKPVAVNIPDGKKEEITVYSDAEGHPVNVEVEANEVPSLRYSFDQQRGSVLSPGGWRTLAGIVGDHTALVTERGGGQGNDGTSFSNPADYPSGARQSAPQWIKSDNGEPALKFDGEATFITLPQGAIPRRAGYTISMDIRPERASGREVILNNRGHFPGTLAVIRDQGMLKLEFINKDANMAKVNTGLHLPENQFSHLEISYDQRHLRASVNDEAGKSMEIEGPGLYDTPTVIGGFGDAWFKGEIKNLQIQHIIHKAHEK